jgi:nickel-dependent lactate racemase
MSNLTESEALSIIRRALEKEDWAGEKVLLILPDSTRSAPVDLLYKGIYDVISGSAACVDGLIALGTHQPMTMESIFRRVGITQNDFANKYSQKTRFFNHTWDDPETLVKIGTISASEVREITNGLMEREVEITINRRIFDYDYLLVIGPVFPHEIVGFSGGNKYFFPGICGQEILNMFHWLGGLISNAVINGTKDTPVRRIINRAAEFITIPRIYFNMVATHGELQGLFVGDGIKEWGMAADLSSRVNVCYTGRRYQKVLGLAPEKYDEIWTAGKVAYKAETIVEDGGQLIIYGPHIKEISFTHGKYINQVGYHVRDYFAGRMEKFRHIPEGVLAHLVAVKGDGSYKDGVEEPRINVILATGIPEEKCRSLNLGYMNPDSINPEEWIGREQESILVIPDAGEVLYKLK